MACSAPVHLRNTRAARQKQRDSVNWQRGPVGSQYGSYHPYEDMKPRFHMCIHASTDFYISKEMYVNSYVSWKDNTLAKKVHTHQNERTSYLRLPQGLAVEQPYFLFFWSREKLPGLISFSLIFRCFLQSWSWHTAQSHETLWDLLLL